MTFTQSFMANWIVFAIITGFFWGLLAVLLWGKGFKWCCPCRPQNVLVDVYQFMFNFIGGASGWVCLKLVYNRQPNFEWVDLALLVLGVLGISGALSAIIYKLPAVVAKKLSDHMV